MNKTLSRWTATAAALLMIFLPGALSAREKRGANVVITMTDGRYVSGELIAVKPDSLLVLNFHGADESVELAGIRRVRIDKKSKSRAGAVTGAVAGTLISGILAAITPTTSWLTGHTHMSASGVILVAATGGAAGGLVGLGIGALSSSDKTLQFEGKFASENRAQALAYLRRHARIRDYR